jgi:hypothetical protein
MKKLQQLKTFEDACKALGLDAATVIPDFSAYPTRDHAAMIAHAKLVIISRAANMIANKGKEWAPNWEDYNEWKYCPWFEMGGSSGFRFDGYAYWRTRSLVGSRLCFISREVATYIGEQFEDLYKQYFTL